MLGSKTFLLPQVSFSHGPGSIPQLVELDQLPHQGVK
jgi:hypothetical protein